MTHTTMKDLIADRGGAQFDGEWPYAVTFPDGSVRYVSGRGPKDAAAKACAAKRCSQMDVVQAAFAALSESRSKEETQK